MPKHNTISSILIEMLSPLSDGDANMGVNEHGVQRDGWNKDVLNLLTWSLLNQFYQTAEFDSGNKVIPGTGFPGTIQRTENYHKQCADTSSHLSIKFEAELAENLVPSSLANAIAKEDKAKAQAQIAREIGTELKLVYMHYAGREYTYERKVKSDAPTSNISAADVLKRYATK